MHLGLDGVNFILLIYRNEDHFVFESGVERGMRVSMFIMKIHN